MHVQDVVMIIELDVIVLLTLVGLFSLKLRGEVIQELLGIDINSIRCLLIPTSRVIISLLGYSFLFLFKKGFSVFDFPLVDFQKFISCCLLSRYYQVSLFRLF